MQLKLPAEFLPLLYQVVLDRSYTVIQLIIGNLDCMRLVIT